LISERIIFDDMFRPTWPSAGHTQYMQNNWDEIVKKKNKRPSRYFLCILCIARRWQGWPKNVSSKHNKFWKQ